MKKKFYRFVSEIMCVVLCLCCLHIDNLHVNSVSNSESRDYYKFTFVTPGGGSAKRTEYTLTETPIANNKKNLMKKSASLDGVFGKDDRYPDTNSSIVELYGRMFSSYVPKYTGGTGFIVGKHTIATAAHCVYDLKTKTCATNFSVKVNYNGNQNVFYVTSIHVPKEYTKFNEDENGRHQYDYALITVQQDLSQYGIFDLGMLADTANNTPITVSGYPSKIINAQGEIEKVTSLYTGKGKLINIEDKVFHYNTDATPGDSGSPVYVEGYYQIGTEKPVNYRTVVGICTGTSNLENTNKKYNDACRLCQPIIKFYSNNENI